LCCSSLSICRNAINGIRLAIAFDRDVGKGAASTIVENEAKVRAYAQIYQMRAGLSLLMKSLWHLARRIGSF